MSPKKKVIEIPATLNHENTSASKSLRVAAYCRVSTDSDEQENSYENQVANYKKYILDHPNWIFVGIYADKGISGKFTKNRPEFLKMINDCRQGKIDRIVTKSISRFARNTRDSIDFVRLLRDMQIGVFFEKENLFTLDSHTDLILTILSSIAEEESRNLSTNVKWTYKKQSAQGIVTLPHKSFGYDLKNKNLVINKREAKVVRLIFDTFEKTGRASDVVDLLKTMKIPSPKNKELWYKSSVIVVLTNEIYIGDLILQKTFTTDFLAKRRENKGEVKKWYIKNNHPAIISREQFEHIQHLFTEKKEHNMRYKNSRKFLLSGLIYCANCGRHFMHNYYLVNNVKIPYWMCVSVKHNKEIACSAPVVKEYVILNAYMSLSNKYTESNIRDKVSKIIIDKDFISFHFLDSTIKKVNINAYK